ncbi:MAG: hypothetical protein JXA21_01520 [Anaerolineae bacterium]|nr:hypothetical protein [Anaerolineae bacterium]
MKIFKNKFMHIFFVGLLVAILGIVLITNRPGNASLSCQEFYAGMENPPTPAHD